MALIGHAELDRAERVAAKLLELKQAAGDDPLVVTVDFAKAGGQGRHMVCSIEHIDGNHVTVFDIALKEYRSFLLWRVRKLNGEAV